MVGTDEEWPTLRARVFEATEGVRWQDGKPWCERHHVVIVPCSRLGLITYDEDEHICHVCVKERIRALVHEWNREHSDEQVER
jgi:hypothetical protein